MSLIPLIFDTRVAYASRGEGQDGSLLTLPLGTTSVLDQLVAQVASDEVSIGYVLVVPQFPVTSGYQSSLRAASSIPVQVISPEILSTKLGEYETADTMLLIEPRLWPVTGYDLAAIRRRLRQYRGATHAVCVGADIHGTQELVERDADGYVKRVHRFYNQVHWPEVARTSIAYSIVPARSARDAQFSSLSELRTILSARGVLSNDIPLVSDVIDLGTERGYLALSERLVAELVGGQGVPRGYARTANEVLLGSQAQVHPGSRLVGPVIVQPRAVIEEGATIIGPALIGASAVVRHGSHVVQAVVGTEAEVAAEVVLRHHVALGLHDQACSAMLPAAAYSEEYGLPGFSRSSSADVVSVPAAAPLRNRRFHEVFKRFVDIAASLTALLVLSPLLLLVAALVKLDSHGPVFFIHRRERKGGRDFPCLKFRTMIQGAHQKQRELYQQNEVDGPQFKMIADPRVTRLGRWLRATNIDELPQFINVLLGHMSLVGPRPSPFRENQICVPWRLARLSVRPGITGLWQVCRADDRSGGDFHEWIYYDLTYVRHFTIWLDFKILAATVLTLGGRWSVPLKWMVRPISRSMTSVPQMATS